jgi:DNA-binding MarR family transcriptional regulator
VLIGREGRRQFVAGIASRAGVDLSPAAAWLLVVSYREPGSSVAELSETWDVPLERGLAGLEELNAHGMVVVAEEGVVASMTPVGRETAEKLIAERRATLSRLLDGWDPERHDEVAGLLTRLAEEVSPSRELVKP